jgi:hypothetical protein
VVDRHEAPTLEGRSDLRSDALNVMGAAGVDTDASQVTAVQGPPTMRTRL